MPPPQHQSSNSNDQTNPGLERPATTFLSYAREDAEEVKYLQQQLNVRGVRAWRDVTDLPLGGSNKPEIVHAIEQESDAFVLYVTQQSLASDFIWDVEVPAALNRWDSDHSYHIIPILYGVTFGELEQHCAVNGIRSLKEFNGLPLPLKDTRASAEEFNRKLREIATRILEATLTLRLRRAGADRRYEPYLYLRTYKFEPPFDSLDLDLNWTDFFPDKDDLPKEKDWEENFIPALDDVKNVLSTKTPSRKLHMFVQAHLPAAFALGFSFPAVAYFTLLIEGRHGTWSSGDFISIPDPLNLLTYEDSGDANVAVMEIAIARDTASGMMRSIQTTGLSYKYHIRFELPSGADHLSGVKDAAQALAMSHQIGRELRRLHDKKGVTHIHLFAALPAALAVMAGHQMNALCAITLYHYIEKDSLYVPICTFGKQKATS